jgi:hypothetical protein
MFHGNSSLRILAAAITLGTVAFSSQASANSLAVQLACATDYYAYCSKHDPDGTSVRGCMRAAGPKLSDRCVNALIGAGEVSKAEVERQKAENGRTAQAK